MPNFTFHLFCAILAILGGEVYMRNSYLAAGIVVVVLVIIVFMIVRSRLPQFKSVGPTPTSVAQQTQDNSITASKHTPAKTAVIDSVTLKEPGTIVVSENANGTPGQMLGQSALLSAGTHENVVIELTRKTIDGEELLATIRKDNGESLTQTTFLVSSQANGFQIPATGLGQDDSE